MHNNSKRIPPQATARTELGKLTLILAAMLITLTSTSQAAAPWSGPIMQPGIAAVTCAVPSTTPTNSAYAFGVFDFRNPPAAMYGPLGTSAPLWNAPAYHHPQWTMTEIGSVYGITLDSDGDMYAAAHGLYSKNWGLSYYHRYGDIGGGPTDLSAAGTIYKIDRISGVPTVFAVIPGQQTMNLGAGWNSGPGIGNIAYDKDNDQFFATSLEDGRIYRIDNTGFVVSSFDPLSIDTGAAGMPSSSDRLWAIEVLNSQVYYSVWNTGSSADPGKIRRVDLNGSGIFLPATDTEILTVPFSPGAGGSMIVPVTDITFSADGSKMVLGERTMFGATSSYNHQSRVHIVEWTGTVWNTTRTHETGNNWANGEAYGGVAYGPESGVQESVIWMSTADSATPAGPHGIQGTRPVDFPLATSPSKVTNSFRVPYDPSYTTSGPDYKGSGGDIEIMQGVEACMEIRVGDIPCPETADEQFNFHLDILNNSGTTAHYAILTPCPDGTLPANATTTQPLPSGVIVLPTPLADGASTSLPVQLPFANAGEQVCFRVTLLDRTGNACCTEKVCVDLPECACAEVLDTSVQCEPQADGTIKYTIDITIRNLTHLTSNPYNFAHATLLPPSGFSPTLVTPSPNPIPPGGVGTITTCYYGAPGRICFNLALHNEGLEECCSPEEICIDLPDCDGTGGEPDTCKSDRRVACCPPDDTATINYTICNNSTAPRTYNWNINGLADPSCTQTLTPSNFFPDSGSVTVAPGDCVTIPITVRCQGFEPGDCAIYEICASYNDIVDPICCKGTVYRPDPDDPVVKAVDPTTGFNVVTNKPTTLTVAVENTGAEPRDLDVTFADTLGILTYEAPGAILGAPSYSVPLQLSPGESQVVTVNLLRLDDGSDAPDFTSLQVWANDRGLFDLGLPAMDLGIALRPQRSADGQGGGFSVTEIKVETEPVPQIALTIPTKRGQRYELQEAPTVLGKWTRSECTSPNTEIDEDGFIVGTGESITLYVPCNADARMMFFRIVGRE